MPSTSPRSSTHYSRKTAAMTACRAVLLASPLLPLLRDFKQTTDDISVADVHGTFYRRRCFPGPRGLLLLLRHVAARAAASRHPQEQVHVRHAQSKIRHNRHIARPRMDGPLEAVPMTPLFFGVATGVQHTPLLSSQSPGAFSHSSA